MLQRVRRRPHCRFPTSVPLFVCFLCCCFLSRNSLCTDSLTQMLFYGSKKFSVLRFWKYSAPVPTDFRSARLTLAQTERAGARRSETVYIFVRIRFNTATSDSHCLKRHLLVRIPKAFYHHSGNSCIHCEQLRWTFTNRFECSGTTELQIWSSADFDYSVWLT